MSAKSHPEELLTLNSLSRKLDITYTRALMLMHRGLLKSDFTASGLHLFRKSRLPEVQALLDQKNGPLTGSSL